MRTFSKTVTESSAKLARQSPSITVASSSDRNNTTLINLPDLADVTTSNAPVFAALTVHPKSRLLYIGRERRGRVDGHETERTSTCSCCAWLVAHSGRHADDRGCGINQHKHRHRSQLRPWNKLPRGRTTAAQPRFPRHRSDRLPRAQFHVQSLARWEPLGDFRPFEQRPHCRLPSDQTIALARSVLGTPAETLIKL